MDSSHPVEGAVPAEAPALGLLEFSSIAVGMRAGDAMVKKAPVRTLVAGSIHPGKYLVLVAGDVASVEESVAAGVDAGEASLLDRLLLPQVHPAVARAAAGARWDGTIDTLGVIETRTSASVLLAADAGMKGARVSLVEVRLGDGLGGKAICLFAGEQHDVEAAVEIGTGRVEPAQLVQQVVVPRLHREMAENLLADTRFMAQWKREQG